MKVTIEFDDELNDALQHHLDGGLSVQAYVKTALRFFNTLRLKEEAGCSVGFGDKNRFQSYNTVVSPKSYLMGNYEPR